MQALEWYLMLGAIAGTLAGLLGVGGGLIIVPALILIFQSLNFHDAVLTHMAIGSSLATITLTAMSSIRTHHQAGKVDWSIMRRLSVGIVLGVALGAWIADALPGTALQGLFGLFTLWAAVQMGFRLKPKPNRSLPQSGGMVVAGGVIGTVSSLFGIGGGSLTVPFLVWCQVAMQRAVGTSAACGLPIAVIGSISYMVMGWEEAGLPGMTTGYVYWPAVLGIVMTSTLFAHLGAKWAHRLPADRLKRFFALLLGVIGVKFLGSGLLYVNLSL